MLDSIETVLLVILPWSFVMKTIALGMMWWALRNTTPTGPLGERINIAFRDQFTMSVFITWAMFILEAGVDATEIQWPFVTIALLGLAIWPFRTGWAHYLVLRKYQEIARAKDMG